jgi:hypothetical protein
MTDHISDKDKCLVLLELQLEMIESACHSKSNGYQEAVKLVNRKIESLNRKKISLETELQYA